MFELSYPPPQNSFFGHKTTKNEATNSIETFRLIIQNRTKT